MNPKVMMTLVILHRQNIHANADASHLIAGAESVDSSEAEFDSCLMFDLTFIKPSLSEVNDYFASCT